MQRVRWISVFGMAALSTVCVDAYTRAQVPPAARTQTAPPIPPEAKGFHKQKSSHAHDFLIIGTVFDDKGYAFPRAELRIRRTNEKKIRWDDYTNSRGEFALRVPQGSDYEMIVHAKGFADQTRSFDAKTGLSEARIVFRMEPVKGEKR